MGTIARDPRKKRRSLTDATTDFVAKHRVVIYIAAVLTASLLVQMIALAVHW